MKRQSKLFLALAVVAALGAGFNAGKYAERASNEFHVTTAFYEGREAGVVDSKKSALETARAEAKKEFDEFLKHNDEAGKCQRVIYKWADQFHQPAYVHPDTFRHM